MKSLREAMSGREIKLLDLPKKGDRCHFVAWQMLLDAGQGDGDGQTHTRLDGTGIFIFTIKKQ